ncbi:MAG: sugar ABC transporter ATP-binding protein [Gammaproteobacteria bacterium]
MRIAEAASPVPRGGRRPAKRPPRSAAPAEAPRDVRPGECVLEARGITKSFPGARALDDVSFDLRAGETHVLFGENGAGKSTLINIIAGARQPDRGELRLEGRICRFHSVHDARLAGIAAVFQEFSLAPDLTVTENIFLGAEPKRGGFLDKRRMHARAVEMLARLGFALDARALVGGLSRAEKQMVEIAKALLTEPRILILDEPTSSLTERETRQLFDLIAALKNQGVGIIYITHRIKEIATIGDRVTVLRDGRYVATLPVSEISEERLVELMTGRSVEEFYPEIEHRPGEVLLSVSRLSTHDRRLNDISFEVRAGEIVGLAGLVGSGKSEIGRACFGLEALSAGEIVLYGQQLRSLSPKAMLKRGLTYIPSDRHREGLMLERPVRENISLSVLDTKALSRFGLLRLVEERSLARRLAQRMRVTPLHLEADVIRYSGGNQQKVLLAKALARETRLFIFDEPTIGIDVGAKIEIYNFLKELVGLGVGILLVSSELPEILNLCNRTYIVRRGRIVAELGGAAITEANALAAFFGEGERP